jgi:hypothetical protein
LQSPPSLQGFPSLQGGQGPPQSTSVSPWFLRLSLHVATAQVISGSQTNVWQSSGEPHMAVAGQAAQLKPPQSGPDSVPFFTLSEQVAC